MRSEEADNQIVVDYEVYSVRPADQSLLLPAIEKHKTIFGWATRLVPPRRILSTAREVDYGSRLARESACELAGRGRIAGLSMRFQARLLAVCLFLEVARLASAACGDRPPDAAQLTAARAEVDRACPCAEYADHAAYVGCVAAFRRGALFGHAMYR